MIRSISRASNQAFRELETEVRDRPQDTVVVFLAGHTGVFDKREILPAAS